LRGTIGIIMTLRPAVTLNDPRQLLIDRAKIMDSDRRCLAIQTTIAVWCIPNFDIAISMHVSWHSRANMVVVSNNNNENKNSNNHNTTTNTCTTPYPTTLLQTCEPWKIVTSLAAKYCFDDDNKCIRESPPKTLKWLLHDNRRSTHGTNGSPPPAMSSQTPPVSAAKASTMGSALPSLAKRSNSKRSCLFFDNPGAPG
jgi:hypothetical protein